ncbi:MULTISPECIES: hypothetical protein [Ralstonia]|jgi:hypothetical protein|uniref:Uncharacterized protein n=2 Tax=Ralstonia pickettii TaxID=329 RepID=R0CNH5_RALPI|nr:hypothetical protein [Ralstonia pickettii]ENZ78040.1 hypothetical protein OR214_02316 [Ralstonia pickettii OR214]MCM3581873.1 hypothetical protein [Ralstonia pickettii]
MKKSVFSHVKHTLVGFVSANPTAEAANMSREQWKQAAGVELKSRSIGILKAFSDDALKAIASGELDVVALYSAVRAESAPRSELAATAAPSFA